MNELNALCESIKASRLKNYDMDRVIDLYSIVDIEKAVDLLFHHIGKKILIFGDYDCDGVTSTYLMVKVLSNLGCYVRHFFPHRVHHGYGLSIKAIDEIIATGGKPDLIITVDNGSTAFEAIAYCKAQGIELLITDHHELINPAYEYPCVVINPHRGCGEGLEHLAGVGVAFALLRSLEVTHPELFKIPMTKYFWIVAIGTIADLVLLNDINIRICEFGIKQLNSRVDTLSPSVRYLLDIVGVTTLNSSHISFLLAPVINACGRLESAEIAFEWLITDDRRKIAELTERVCELNTQRKELEKTTHDKAWMQAAREQYLANAFIPETVESVVGIVAGRLMKKLKKPALCACFSEEPARIKASLRSHEGLHITNLLTAATADFPDGVIQFGGHAAAAGLTVHRAWYDKLLNNLKNEISKIPAVYPERAADASLTETLINEETCKALTELIPYGNGCPPPLFEGIFTVTSCEVLKDKHLCLQVALQGGHKQFPAMFFFNNTPLIVSKSYKCLYTLTINDYTKKIQLLIDTAVML